MHPSASDQVRGPADPGRFGDRPESRIGTAGAVDLPSWETGGVGRARGFGPYSSSTRICPCWTASPTLALILATLPATGAVITVSIFIASRTIRTSSTWMVCPTWAETRETVPEKGLRQTLLSSVAGAPLGRAGVGATGAAAGMRACPVGGT